MMDNSNSKKKPRARRTVAPIRNASPANKQSGEYQNRIQKMREQKKQMPDTLAANRVKNVKSPKVVKPPLKSSNRVPKSNHIDNKKIRTVNKPSGYNINEKLRTQTPAKREEVRRSKHVNGSVKNIEIKRREKSSRQTFYVKKKKTGFFKLILSRLILFFISFIIIFAIAAGAFLINLNSGKLIEASDYKLLCGEDANEKGIIPEDTEVYLIKGSNAQRNGVLYFPIDALSELCQLTITGLNNDLKYIPRESTDQSIRFIVGTNTAYVNGERIHMSAPSFTSGDQLYIPLDFLEKYTNGLIINKDDKLSKIVISRYITGQNETKDKNIYANLTFKLHCPVNIASIPEPQDESTKE